MLCPKGRDRTESRTAIAEAERQPGPFAEVLHHYRLAAGLSQEELAERAGLSLRGVSDLERGLRTRPHPHTVRQLADALELASRDRALLTQTAHVGSAVHVEMHPNGLRPARALPIGGFLGAFPPASLMARDRELQSVLELLDAVDRGQGRLVMLAGEPGIGKTRLAQEVAVIARDRGFVVATGRCYEPEQVVPFYPFLESLTEASRAAPPTLKAQIPQRWPHLDRLLPDYAVGDRGGNSIGTDGQQALFWAVSGFLQTLAAVTPVALLLDDLHWADESTLKLFQHLARHLHADRVLLLGTYRDVDVKEAHPLERTVRDLHRDGLLAEVMVRRLDQDGTAALAAAILGETKISDEFAALLHRHTGGNPFFTQEVARALVERGEAVHGEGSWDPRALEATEIPRSIRSAIGERLSRLGEEARAVLREASVLGQVFGFGDLEAMDNRGEAEVEAALDAAVAAGLVRVTGKDDYAFSHALVRQALYDELPPRTRRRLHQESGKALERLRERVRQERAAELAWHFLQADKPEQALSYSVLAGDRAEVVFAHAEAEQHYGRALDLARHDADPVREAQILERIGATRMTSGRYVEALEVLERAAGIYERVGDPEAEGRVVARIGELHARRDTEQEGLERLAPVVERMKRAGPSAGLAALYVTQSRLEFVAGRYNQQLAVAERAVEVARQVGDTRVLASALLARGGALGNMGRSDGLDVILDVLPLAEAAGDNDILYRARRNAGVAFQSWGGLERGADHLEKALGLAERMGDPTAIARIHLDLAANTFVAGRWPDTRRHIELVQVRTRVSGPIGLRAGSLDFLVRLSLGEGEIEGAVQAAADYAELAEAWNTPYARLTAQTLLAKVALARGERAAALERLEPLRDGLFAEKHLPYLLELAEARLSSGDQAGALRAADGAAQLGADYDLWPYALDIRRVRGSILAGMERWEEAEDDFEAALQEAGERGARYAEGLALLEWGLALSARGDGPAARARLEAALAICEELGAYLCVRRAEEALGVG